MAFLCEFRPPQFAAHSMRRKRSAPSPLPPSRLSIPTSSILFLLLIFLQIANCSSCDVSLPPFNEFRFIHPSSTLPHFDHASSDQNYAYPDQNHASTDQNSQNAEINRNVAQENADKSSAGANVARENHDKSDGARRLHNDADRLDTGAVRSKTDAGNSKTGAINDVIIGGVFDVHEETSSREFLCRGNVNPQNIQRLEAFLWAVSTIKSR